MVYHASRPGDPGKSTPISPPDTIAAVATPPGRGGIGIVRISGALVNTIALAVLGKLPPPRHAGFLRFRDATGACLDSGVALYFPGPRSFTGEDVLELHGHGGPVMLNLLLMRIIALGARPARPGEFSERAFLNGKIDLAQAEAVADLIDAASDAAARAATRSLQGEFSQRINALIDRLTGLRAYVESAIDFPEEDIDFLRAGDVCAQISRLITDVKSVIDAARQGHRLREGMRIVITGRPNVGKSSLLNRLAGRDAAIVSAIPGTTRDVLEEAVQFDGVPLQILDTAGLHSSTDEVEIEGMRRAWELIAGVDHVLLVADDSVGLTAEDRAILAKIPAKQPVTLIFNKADLSGSDAGESAALDGPELRVSARTGAGFAILRAYLKQRAGHSAAGEGIFTARLRHLDALERASASLRAAREQAGPHDAAELVAEDLRQAQNALGEITGVFGADDLLGKIFAQFCIGK